MTSDTPNWLPDTHERFWHRLCESLFIKSSDWHDLIKRLPEQLDMVVVERRTQPYVVLESMHLRAQGWIGKEIQVVPKPNPIREGDFMDAPVRWAYLQVFSQFSIMEGFFDYLMLNGRLNPSSWTMDLVDQLLELSMTSSFFSAFLILADKGLLPPEKDFNTEEVVRLVRTEIEKITVTLSNKTQDYGQAFLRHGALGLLYRLWDKLARFATLSAENRASKFESRRDTAMDMLGYSVLIWSILVDIKQMALLDTVSTEGSAN